VHWLRFNVTDVHCDCVWTRPKLQWHYNIPKNDVFVIWNVIVAQFQYTEWCADVIPNRNGKWISWTNQTHAPMPRAWRHWRWLCLSKKRVASLKTFHTNNLNDRFQQQFQAAADSILNNLQHTQQFTAYSTIYRCLLNHFTIAHHARYNVFTIYNTSIKWVLNKSAWESLSAQSYQSHFHYELSWALINECYKGMLLT